MRRFCVNRKIMYVVLALVLVSIFSLSIAYAALSVTLNITGNAEVVASNWDIHLDNPKVRNGSVHNNLPTISGNTLAFSSDLATPGDFYEFTVDVVNDGTIDAVIDSVVVNPVLTDSQKKYLRYEVTYENGESISSKQILKKKSSMPIKFRVEFRNDISVSDLPNTSTTLNHSVILVYSQSNGNGSIVNNQGVAVAYASGNINDIGTIVTIGSEKFYVIGSEGDNVKLLAMYNLHVGNTYDDVNGAVAISSPTGLQNLNAIGWFSGYSKDNPIVGTQHFSQNAYWDVSSYPSYVYNSDSLLYEYVENYKNSLFGLGVQISDARLPSYEEVVSLGCNPITNKCFDAPDFLYSTTYWLGSAYTTNGVWYVGKDANFHYNYINDSSNGVRPVIVIPKNSIVDSATISFTINDADYYADFGMTWESWINSDYNTYGFKYSDGGYVYSSSNRSVFLSDCVLKNDAIVDGSEYTIKTFSCE